MNNPYMRILKVITKAIPYYTCDNCKIIREGRSFEQVDSTQDVLLRKPSNNHMPVGWSSYYRKDGDIYICSDCKEKENQNG